MPLRSLRATVPFLIVPILALAPLAQAQVTLNLTTTQQTDCTAVTDASGLRLAPGGTNFLATGVTLTGTGCGGSGGDDYAVGVQAPTSATVGTPFTVSWSASSKATQCIYSGTPGATNWNVGSAACSGSSCNGTHSVQVTATDAVSYSFGMTCTNATGYAAATTTATGIILPPSPANFVLSTTPVSPVTVGTPFQVNWNVQYATSCTGTASFNGTPLGSLAGWTDVGTSPTPPRSITPTQAGTYTLSLTCSNSVGSVTSAPLDVVAQASNTDNCPAGRLTSGTICYNYVTSGNSCVTADLTQFSNIWGRQWLAGATPPHISSPVIPFPGTQPSIATTAALRADQYVSAKFTVPATGGLPANQTGVLYRAETFPGVPVEMSITSDCGNFTPTNQYCAPNPSPRNPGQSIGQWRLQTAPGAAYCPLQPGQSYFINYRIKSTTDCPTPGACYVTILSNHSP